MPDDSLYVGYLPLPPRHARFLRMFIPASLWALVILNGAILLASRDPGAATWNTNDTVTIEGRLADVGAIVLVTPEGETVLLASTAKRGPDRELLEKRVGALAGFVMEREGRRMLELAPDQSASVEGASSPGAPLDITPGKRITVRGEILDAKCFLGAMKPGHGKPHKACATLCIRGGIPAAMAVRGADGTDGITLIVGPGRTPFPEALLPYIADPIEITGKSFRIGDLNVIEVDPASVRRL